MTKRTETYSDEEMRILSTPICDLSKEEREELRRIMAEAGVPLLIMGLEE